ncbi:SPW repeat protein [Streptacidiphilus sp. N1-10]|uniref:SPW repeat protein n=1 Tax=Streptacidiphilus jeojiensis TaxID=3229225 RepID=A0ABV6XP22_9ACTN
MSDLGHRAPDITGHPDAAEMRERYAQVLEGTRAVAVDGLMLLTGLYAAISPWVVHFHGSNAELSANNLIIGIALAVFGLGLATMGERIFRLGWTCTALGVWMIISPWVVTVGHSPTRGMIWNNVLIGAIACALGLAVSGMMMLGARRGTGK